MKLEKSLLGVLVICSVIICAGTNASAAEKVFKCTYPKPADIGKFLISKLSASLATECPSCTDAKIRVKIKPVKQTGEGLLSEGLAGVAKPVGTTDYLAVFTEGYEILPSQCTQTVPTKITISYKLDGVKKTTNSEVSIKLNGQAQ